MTDIAIFIAKIMGIFLLLAGAWEAVAWLALGPVREDSDQVWKWLEADLVVYPFYPNKLYKRPGERFTNPEIYYIAEHRPTIFSKYYVECFDGESFRILRGSSLHYAIERIHNRLLKETEVRTNAY